MNSGDIAFGFVALAALVLPGWILARALHVAAPLLAGFVASATGLVSVILALDIAKIPLTAMTCGGTWCVITVAIVWWTRRSRTVPDADSKSTSFTSRMGWPLSLVLVPGLAVVIYRAAAQPLFGIDTVFRWNYLAETMLAQKSLAFYPAVTAADFTLYSWPDGIAPAVSAIYFWAYALAGRTSPGLTTAAVVFQYALILAVTNALARRTFSERAAAFATALVACSPVVAWATAMGQETGLTALGLAAMLLYLPRDRREESAAAAFFAGLAAGLGALAREYGVAFVIFGIALTLVRRLSTRTIVWFASAALLASMPWYVRNWVRTGNPFFGLDVAHIFPTNPVHQWLLQSYQAEFGWFQLSSPALWFFLANCGLLLACAIFGAVISPRPARVFVVAIALGFLIWALSLSYTAAGFTTAIRVLSPALVLAAVLGGAACARLFSEGRSLRLALVILGLLAMDGALRALTLPGTVYKIPPQEWLHAGNAVHEYHSRPVYAQIARLAGPHRILVLGPNALLTRAGARTLPLWSPEVKFLFDDTLTAAEIARRLTAQQIGFMVLNGGPANERFLAHSAYFRNPGETLSALRVDDEVVLRVNPPKN